MNFGIYKAGTFVRERMAGLARFAADRLETQSPAHIHQEFEARVLEHLLALGETWVPVVGIKCNTLDCSSKIMCMGLDRQGLFRKFSIKFSLPLLAQRKVLGDPKAVAEIAFAVLADSDPTKGV